MLQLLIEKAGSFVTNGNTSGNHLCYSTNINCIRNKGY
jgi:hypothetical protein